MKIKHPILIAVAFRRACKKKFKPLEIPEHVRIIAKDKFGIIIK